MSGPVLPLLQRTPFRLVLLAFLALAALAVACGGNADSGIEADEFIRPPAPGAAVAAAEADATPPAAAEEQTAAETDAPPPDDAAPEPAAAPDDDGGIELADDIVRRYLNDYYGYSLELVCGPFCDATSAAIDRVGFLSNERTSLINIEARAVDPAQPPDLAALEADWIARSADNDSFIVLSRKEILLASDGVSPALEIEWEIDRRATGGFLEHYRSLIVQVGPIAYFINAGGIADDFDAIEPSLARALASFFAPTDPPGVPGAFSKREFVFPYDVSSFVGELGNRTPVPSFDSGVFIQQSASGQLRLVLIWDSVAEALFDRDAAIQDALNPGGAPPVDELSRGATTVDDVAASFVVAATSDSAGNPTRVAVIAWYCTDGGRSFVLQSFDPEDPLAAAEPSLSGFRCRAS